jgi:hypothetical protein
MTATEPPKPDTDATEESGTRYDIAEAGVIILRDSGNGLLGWNVEPVMRVGDPIYIDGVHYRVKSISRPRVLVDVERVKDSDQ